MDLENALNPYPSYFRVIAPHSSYRNEVGVLLNQKKVKEQYRYSFGRDDHWYATYPCLLTFFSDLEEYFKIGQYDWDAGIGFGWDEVEKVELVN